MKKAISADFDSAIEYGCQIFNLSKMGENIKREEINKAIISASGKGYLEIVKYPASPEIGIKYFSREKWNPFFLLALVLI